MCHGNNGSGKTDIGQNVYPRAPDLREQETQRLSDGELFYIIRNGVRFTAMPAWGDDPPEDDRHSWILVHFIRHLPEITEQELEEMKPFNPISQREIEGEEADLIGAASRGNVAKVQAHLAKGADVNRIRDNDGGTALMVASLNGHLEVVQALLAKGADVSAKANDGATALILASGTGHPEVVQALVAKGADVNAKTNNGWTALMLADQRGHKDVVKLLRQHGGH